MKTDQQSSLANNVVSSTTLPCTSVPQLCEIGFAELPTVNPGAGRETVMNHLKWLEQTMLTSHSVSLDHVCLHLGKQFAVLWLTCYSLCCIFCKPFAPEAFQQCLGGKHPVGCGHRNPWPNQPLRWPCRSPSNAGFRRTRRQIWGSHGVM